jgi:uncharacterized membrane protein HdeD (DUF308 family)
MTVSYGQRGGHRLAQRDPSALWPALLLVGVGVTVLGVLLVARPFSAASTLAVLAGVALLLSGLSETMTAARTPHASSTVLFGLLLVAGGVLVLVWPGVTVRVVAVLVGCVLIVTGLVRAAVVAAARRRRPERGTAVPLALAGLSVLIGVLALVWPSVTIAVLTLLFGIELIVTGVAEIVLALEVRPRRA